MELLSLVILPTITGLSDGLKFLSKFFVNIDSPAELSKHTDISP